jgi:hypothetical protein
MSALYRTGARVRITPGSATIGSAARYKGYVGTILNTRDGKPGASCRVALDSGPTLWFDATYLTRIVLPSTPD